MISIVGNVVSIVWDKKIEDFFEDRHFYLAYPWVTRNVIKYGALVTFPKNLTIEPYSCMAQGKFYSAGSFSYCRSRLIPPDFSVGRYCSIAPGVELSDQDHPTDRLSTHSFTFKQHAKQLAKTHGKEVNVHHFNTLKKSPSIGHDVWIGKDVLIKRGVKIGNGAVVGQRSIVTKDVPDYAVVVGAPARIIKYRFSDDLIDRLSAFKWWGYSYFDFADLNILETPAFLDAFQEKLSKGGIFPLSGKINVFDELSKKFDVVAK